MTQSVDNLRFVDYLVVEFPSQICSTSEELRDQGSSGTESGGDRTAWIRT